MANLAAGSVLVGISSAFGANMAGNLSNAINDDKGIIGKTERDLKQTATAGWLSRVVQYAGSSLGAVKDQTTSSISAIFTGAAFAYNSAQYFDKAKGLTLKNVKAFGCTAIGTVVTAASTAALYLSENKTLATGNNLVRTLSGSALFAIQGCKRMTEQEYRRGMFMIALSASTAYLEYQLAVGTDTSSPQNQTYSTNSRNSSFFRKLTSPNNYTNSSTFQNLTCPNNYTHST